MRTSIELANRLLSWAYLDLLIIFLASLALGALMLAEDDRHWPRIEPIESSPAESTDASVIRVLQRVDELAYQTL